MNMLKKNWIYILIAILVAIIFFQTCNNGKVQNRKNDTTYVHDTTEIKTEGKVVFKPVPYKVEVPVTDTFYIPDTSKRGYKDAYFKTMYELLTKNYYKDSISVEDTLGLKGVIVFEDTVYKNKLYGKSVKYNISYPKIKETITITKYPDPKNQLYFGTSLLGNSNQFVGGAKVDLSLKTRKEQIYEIGAQYWNGEIIYFLGTKWKISLKGKK